MSRDASEIGNGADGEDGDDTRRDEEHKVIRLQIVRESEPAASVEPEPEAEQADELLQELRRRSGLKRNGDAMTLTEALHEAGGGADRVQLQVIRERLSGLENRAADSQAMLRKQGRMLERIRLLLYGTLGVAVAGAAAAVIVLLR